MIPAPRSAMIGADPVPNGNGCETREHAQEQGDEEQQEGVDDDLHDEASHRGPPGTGPRSRRDPRPAIVGSRRRRLRLGVPSSRGRVGSGSDVLPCATWRATARPSQSVSANFGRTSRCISTRVKQGEAFAVTEHGHPVARLVPNLAAVDPLDRLIAEGRAVSSRRSHKDLSPPPRILGVSLGADPARDA